MLLTHRYPPLCSEGSHSLQLLVRHVDRHCQCWWVGVTKFIVIVYLCYPPAFIGYTLYKQKSNPYNCLSLSSSRMVGSRHFQIPVFCIQRQRRTPSIRFLGILAHIQMQRFATKSVWETDQWVHSTGLKCQKTAGLTHLPARWKQEMQISSALRKWTSWVCPPFACVRIVDCAYPARRQKKRSWSNSEE